MFRCMFEPTMPSWYDLSLLKTNHGITISVPNQTYTELLSWHLATAPGVLGLQRKHGLPEFTSPNDGPWGFGEVLMPADPPLPNWHSWNCEWPQLDTSLQNPWEPLVVTCANLEVLFTILSITKDIEVDSDIPQIAEYILQSGKGMGMWGVWAGLAPTATHWLHQFPANTHHVSASEAMLAAWKHLCGEQNRPMAAYDHHTVYAITRYPGALSFHCPGQACDLGTMNSDITADPSYGYALSPHNVDTPMQQLTLLTGLVSICQNIRQSLAI